jgi:Flagellar capping protein
MSDRMRITGMYSGMDTESIVQQLVSVKQKKVDDLKNEQKKLGWKQTAWQDLNAKIYSLYSGTLSKLRLSSAFKKQKTTISDATKATVTAGGGAVNGEQTLKIKEVAKQGYLTGAKLNSTIKYTSSNSINGIIDQNNPNDDVAGQRIKVTTTQALAEGDKYKTDANGNKIKATQEDLDKESNGLLRLETAKGGEKAKVETVIKFTKEMTINDFVGELKKAGLNASFDETYQRFFISAKETGAENDFTIENLPATNSDGAPMGNALALLGLDTNSSFTYADGTTGTASKINGHDATIELNGSEFTSSSNTFNINGLTITAMAKTADDEEIVINTTTDIDGIYNTIKDFLTEYNDLINQMDKLYNADSARKYSMLSAEDKESMTDEEVETWENTIKGSLLRKDSQLSSVMSSLTNAMMGGVSVNGKTTYLANYGIKTLGYFKAKDNEHHAYYIDGDPDDDNVSGEEDMLRKALLEDPDGTADFFAGLCKNLYGALDKTMSQTSDYSSIYKVYNDKQLQKDYDNYTKKIKEAEQKLSDYEDRWYDKFSKMETALSKLQSNQSVVSSMLGN